MSQYSHDLHKFADQGLQLRVPVDLVPANQYSRLTNVLPQIEGQIGSRDGLLLVGSTFNVANVTGLATALFPANTGVFFTPLAPGDAGFLIGQSVTIVIIANVPGASAQFTLGSYPVTITGRSPDFSDSTGYRYTPLITPSGGFGPPVKPVFAQAISSDGRTLLQNMVITNLFRLNQSIPNYNGDLLAVMSGRIYHAPLPAENVFYELVNNSAVDTPPLTNNQLSQRPVSIISFRFTQDPATWAIIADQNQMYRYRENPGGNDGGIYFYKLGKPAPATAASAVDNGVGVLNSTGGTGYDWRYTWYDGTVKNDGNPSPITTGPPDTERPTAFSNPFTKLGVHQTPVSAPGNAIDGDTTTFTSAVGSSSEQPGQAPVVFWQTCEYTGVPNPASPPTADIFLNVTFDATLVIADHGSFVIEITYSTDNGVTYQFLTTSRGSVALNTISKKLDAGLNYANIRVAIAGGAYAGNGTMTLRVYDIKIQTASTSGALNLVSRQALVTVANPNTGSGTTAINDGRITSVRLWRRGGSLTDAWRSVGIFAIAGTPQDANGNLLLTDNVSDATLSTQDILQLDNDPPVTSVNTVRQLLPFIWGPVGLDARVLGCGDPQRPECVYFSKPGDADQWPPQNFLEVCDPGTPVIAGCVFNTRTYAFSREAIYELVEGLGAGTTFTPFKTPSVHGLFTPWGLALGPSIYFVAKDGIYETTGGQETSLVENDIKPLFPTYDKPGKDVHGYEAVDMTLPDAIRLRYHNSELYFCYIGQTSGRRQMLIYDILKKRWRAAQYTVGISEVYSEPSTVSSLLMGSTGGSIYRAGGNSDPVALEVIEDVLIQAPDSLGVPVTLTPGTYFVSVTRLTSVGEMGKSNERTAVVDATHNIQVLFTGAEPTGTTGWRVYFRIQPGTNDQFIDFPAGQQDGSVLNVYAAGTAGSPPIQNADPSIHCLLRTGSQDQGAPLNQKQYGNVIIDLDPNGADAPSPITITPYINGEIQSNAAITITGTGRQQVPLDLTDYFAFNTEYEIAWARTLSGTTNQITDPTLFQYDTLHFIEPVAVRHWQAQPTSFGFPGFVHCRDAYIAIRSTAIVTLTVRIDGIVNQIYTIASTNGQRLKQYVQFSSNKGLMYEFSLDSTSDFHVYERDLEIRVKPWLGVLGYSQQRVLGGEVNA